MKNEEKEEMSPMLRKLWDSGIPVTRTNFQAAVNNSDGTPENYFSDESANKSRRVEMRWTPHGMICLHKGKYFVVPPPNYIFANFK